MRTGSEKRQPGGNGRPAKQFPICFAIAHTKSEGIRRVANLLRAFGKPSQQRPFIVGGGTATTQPPHNPQRVKTVLMVMEIRNCEKRDLNKNSPVVVYEELLGNKYTQKKLFFYTYVSWDA